VDERVEPAHEPLHGETSGRVGWLANRFGWLANYAG
jgi:hypothetical protein